MRYACLMCTYVYDPATESPGIVLGTQFMELPADWVCPVCGVGKDEFELIKEVRDVG